MQEVEAICDRVIIIDHGKIVTDKKIDRLVAVTQEQIIDVEFDRAITSELIQAIVGLVTAKNVGTNLWELTFHSDADMRSVVFDFAQENGLYDMKIEDNPLIKK
jgi:ABC-2 type transport system ATP-binding protein